MAFQKFINCKMSVKPAVTWAKKSGRFIFNQPAVKAFNLEQYSFCWLHFDKEKNKIGFEFIKSPENGACKVANYRYTFNVAGLSFVNYFGCKFKSPKKMNLMKVDENFFYINI